MNLVLCKPTCFTTASPLSYKAAIQALEKAQASAAGRYFSFFLAGAKDGTWNLMGMHKETCKLFLADSEGWVISIEE